MDHVIVGAGPAGVIAAETLRRLDPGCKVTLIGDEPEPPYSRMALPYLLSDRIAEPGTYLRKAEAHYERMRIDVRRSRVASVSPAEHSLGLAYLEKKDARSAVEYLQRAAEISPDRESVQRDLERARKLPGA